MKQYKYEVNASFLDKPLKGEIKAIAKYAAILSLREIFALEYDAFEDEFHVQLFEK